jgi:hypothetical protein
MSNLKPITVHMDTDMIKACEKLQKKLKIGQRSTVFRLLINTGIEVMEHTQLSMEAFKNRSK